MATSAPTVLLFSEQRQYPTRPPYHPPEPFPELEFLGRFPCDPNNGIYAGVRRLLHLLGYDKDHFGTASWSPLSDLVGRGGTVVLKPNFVRHYNEDLRYDIDPVVTHPSILRPLIDYALKAVGPEGRVIVADAPHFDCEIEVLLERNRLPELLAWYRDSLGVSIEWRDLRVEFGRHIHGIQTEKRKLPGDPEGYQAVDLGSASEFASLDEPVLRRLRGADYDEEVTIFHHRGGRNEYLVARTILQADLVINCPKVKTHKKTGVTLSTKNLIGINGDKNWLPHYRAGFQAQGGDEFPRADLYSRLRRVGGELGRRMLKRGLGGGIFRHLRGIEESVGLGRRARNGNWYGNDTIWRACLDLNKILYFGDREGRLRERGARRVLNLYDGIVAGEGNGPMGPTPRPIGLLAASEDGVLADIVLTWIMGFDWRRTPVLGRAVGELQGGIRLTSFTGDHEEARVVLARRDCAQDLPLSQLQLDLRFEPHPGWKNFLERPCMRRAACDR